MHHLSRLLVSYGLRSNRSSFYNRNLQSISNFKSLSRTSIHSNYSSAAASSSDLDVIPVKAYYISQGIDILKVHSNSTYRSCPATFQSKSVTITINEEKQHFISVFKYGSIVFFNIPEYEHEEYIAQIQDASIMAPIPFNLQLTEAYSIYLDQNYSLLKSKSMLKEYEKIILRNLDHSHIQVVAGVMAQTVAMDHYAVLVDKMVDSFMSMNVDMGKSGKIKEYDRRKLFSLIASNNTVIFGVVSKLGIFEGSDVAWEDPDAWDVWDILRKDFELDYRFKDLSMKLEIVKDNTKFFLEILNDEKSRKLEWTIIGLIAAEIVISLTDLSLHYFK